MDLKLSGKVVVITGGTKGIGLQISADFLSEGAIVIAIARNQPTGTEFEILQKKFSNAFFFKACDITNEDEIQDCCADILKQRGKIDIVVANVGNGASTKDPISNATQWNKVWDLNFNSALYTARVFADALIASKGSLLFISSITGLEFIGAPSDYSTAKSAVISLAKTLSHRLAPNVRVNVVIPGNVWTAEGTWKNKMEQDPAAVNAMLETRVPLKRFGQPAEISNAVLFLSSSKASFITGSCLVVDGGQTTGFH